MSDDEEEDEEEVKEGNDDTDGAVKPNNRNGEEEQESADEDGVDRRSILAAPKAKKGKVSDIPQGPSLRKKRVGNDAAAPSKDPEAAKLKNKKHDKRAQDKQTGNDLPSQSSKERRGGPRPSPRPRALAKNPPSLTTDDQGQDDSGRDRPKKRRRIETEESETKKNEGKVSSKAQGRLKRKRDE